VLTWEKGDWPGMGDLSLPWGPSTEEIYVLGRGFLGRRGGSVVRCDRVASARANHPTEKPVALLAALLGRCPRGVIVDPFMGVGSVLCAARDHGRAAIGIEVDERYCEIAAKRLEGRSGARADHPTGRRVVSLSGSPAPSQRVKGSSLSSVKVA